MKYALLTITIASIFSGCAGTPPTNLGIENDTLSPCPNSPNCVSSQATDVKHFIEPIRYDESLQDAMDTLLTVLDAEPRITIVDRDSRYIRAEARTRILRFVDDVEFYFDENEKRIHVRSASRLGESDLGENRKRIEGIRIKFQSGLSATTAP
jgi:uncharacterized protein (DUF1499 family)